MELLHNAETAGRRVSDEDLRKAAPGVSEHLFHNVMKDLIDEGYIQARTSTDGGSPFPEYGDTRLRARGRQVVKDWPDSDVFESFIIALDNRIAASDDQEERSKLEQVKRSAVEMGRTVLTSVLTAVVKDTVGLG